MNQSRNYRCRAFIAHHQSAEVLQPRVSALNNPSAPVTPELSAILMCGCGVVRAGRDYWLNVTPEQQCSNFVTVVASICNQPLGLAALTSAPCDTSIVQCRLKQFYLRRGSLLHVYSERSTRAIGQYHELCSLAPFSLPGQCTPLFAVINMPPMKHSSQRTFLRSSNWSRKARHISRSTPDSAHVLSLRCTVLFEPYLSGNSLHGAPLQSIHKMPSKHLRSSAGGRPPFVRRLPLGSCSLISSHCLSVTARQAIENLRELVSYQTQTTCQTVLG
jgi:hypothetical protein